MYSIKVRALSRVISKSWTIIDETEWEVFREENKIMFLELLRGT